MRMRSESVAPLRNIYYGFGFGLRFQSNGCLMGWGCLAMKAPSKKKDRGDVLAWVMSIGLTTKEREALQSVTWSSPFCFAAPRVFGNWRMEIIPLWPFSW